MRVCPYTLQLVVTPKEALMAGQEAPLPHSEEEGKSCLTHVALSHETPILPMIHYYSRVLILFSLRRQRFSRGRKDVGFIGQASWISSVINLLNTSILPKPSINFRSSIY